MKTRHIVKAVVVSDNNSVLMLRRSKTDVRRPLQWDLPGGYRDLGESLEDCVLRELQEEAEIKAHSPHLIFAKTEIREWVDKVTGNHIENVVFLFYIVRVSTNEVRLSHEHSEYQWAQLDDAIRQFEYPLHKEVLEHLALNKLLHP